MCECFKEVLKKIEDKVKPDKDILEWDIDWKGRVLRLDGGLGVGLRVEYTYRNIKKDKTPYSKITKDDVFVAMSFCPFCGNSLKKKEQICLKS